MSETGGEGTERRRLRAPFRGWVELACGRERCRATGRDLSAGGVGVSLAAPWSAAGQILEAELALPGIGLPLVVAGRVAWRSADGLRLGIAFHQLDPGLAEILEAFARGRLI